MLDSQQELMYMEPVSSIRSLDREGAGKGSSLIEIYRTSIIAPPPTNHSVGADVNTVILNQCFPMGVSWRTDNGLPQVPRSTLAGCDPVTLYKRRQIICVRKENLQLVQKGRN
jgi:hypothetical protein